MLSKSLHSALPQLGAVVEVEIEENPDGSLLPVQACVEGGIDAARQGTGDDILEGTQARHLVARDTTRHHLGYRHLHGLGGQLACAASAGNWDEWRQAAD